MNSRRDIIVFCIFVTLSFAVILIYAVRGQKNLPHPTSDVWQQFAACKVTTHYLDGNYSIAFAPAVAAMDGKTITADGFMLPLESSGSFRHFLLSLRSPSCPYCPPAAPNEMIEVFSSAPVRWTDQLVTVRGILSLAAPKNTEGIFFQLRNATSEVNTGAWPAPVSATSARKAIESYSFTPLDKPHGPRRITLTSWLGRAFAIVFWRADCAPCLEELKALPAIARQNPDIPLLLISLKDEAGTQIPRSTLPGYIQVLVSRAEGKEMLGAFGNDRILALPYSVMIDAEGKVCGRHYGILAAENFREWRTQCNVD